MGIKTKQNRPPRGKHNNGRAVVRPVGGRYASMLVGPAVGLTVLCAHAQTAPSMPTPASAPVAASATTAAAPAKPQAPAKTAATGNATTLNTVEITANRRREPAREVPMQVNALSSEELQRKGDASMRDYLTKEPGVSLSSAGAGNCPDHHARDHDRH